MNYSIRERNNIVRNDLRRVYDSNFKLGKFKFFVYDVNNVLKIMWNNILEDFINSFLIGIGVYCKFFLEENKMREKYFKEKFNLIDLMLVLIESFLDKNDVD